jgi:photosystem II stability/assembly factor-like uncharacterized protein
VGALCLVLVGAVSAGAGEWSGGGPEIGWVRTLLETSDGTLYAGTWGGGIFRSADGGRHWIEATSNATDTVVLDLAEGIDSRRSLYAATLDRSLLRKEQDSDFWSQLGRYPIGAPPAGISVEIFPFRDSRIAFGSDVGVFVSSDRGNSWPDTLTFATGQAIHDLVVLPQIPNTIHALTPLEMVVTSDTGRSEQFLSAGLAPVTYLIDLEPWSAGTDSMLVADQRGPLWQLVDRERFIEVGPVEVGAPSNKYVCRIDPLNADRILLGSSVGLWRSEDRLGSWGLVDDGMPAFGSEIWAMEPRRVGSTDSMRLGSFTLGFLRTGPGGDAPWTVSNSGLTAAWATTVMPRSGSVLCGTAHGRLFRSIDNGQSWQDVTGGLRTLQISVSHDTGTAWVVSGSNGVVRSMDGGVSWVPVNLASGVTRLNHLVQRDAVLFAATNAGLVRSDDDGRTFQRPSGALPVDRSSFTLAQNDTGYLAVAFERNFGGDPPEIFVGHPDSLLTMILPPAGFNGGVRGMAFVGDDLIVGTNGFGGSPLYRLSNWRRPLLAGYEDLSAQIGDGFFQAWDLDARANVVAVGTTEEGVFLSEDSGRTWREWNEGLPSRRIESIAFGPDAGRSLWVSTMGRGAFVRELDVGVPLVVSGLRVEPGPEGVRVRVAVAHPARLRVARRSDSLGDQVLFEGEASADLELRDELPLIAASEERVRYTVEVASGSGWIVVMELERSLRELVLPPRSRLLAAMPNPFNPRTTLSWELAEAGRVRLEIFDVRGRRVRKLVDRDLPAGPHAIGFDGRDDDGRTLASGVYYMRLDTGDRQLRGRITLVR